MVSLNIETYDGLLDAFDNERSSVIIDIFKKYCLEPHSNLFDAPRYTENINIVLTTYLEYVLYYNLIEVLDLFIDNMGLVIDDEVIASSILLQNIETYNHLCELGYNPEIQSLKIAIQFRYSEIVDSILSSDNELIYLIEEDDIENLLNSSIIDEETVETITVLCNYGINKNYFVNFLNELKLRYKYICHTNKNSDYINDDNKSQNQFNIDSEIQSNMLKELINILDNY